MRLSYLETGTLLVLLVGAGVETVGNASFLLLDLTELAPELLCLEEDTMDISVRVDFCFWRMMFCMPFRT